MRHVTRIFYFANLSYQNKFRVTSNGFISHRKGPSTLSNVLPILSETAHTHSRPLICPWTGGRIVVSYRKTHYYLLPEDAPLSLTRRCIVSLGQADAPLPLTRGGIAAPGQADPPLSLRVFFSARFTQYSVDSHVHFFRVEWQEFPREETTTTTTTTTR